MKLSDKEKARLKAKYGEWAVITGATSGIGLELAVQLASAGFNLVLIARHLDKLQEVENRLKANTSIEIKIVNVDVSEAEGIDQIIEATKGTKVGLLIASAGYGTSGNFIDSSLHSEINMLRVNCEALLSLTHYFGQHFANQSRGGIILMSSMVAFQGTPFSANYAATKAYVQTLAEGIAVELKSKGVDVLAAAPGPVESGFSKRANMKMSMSLTPSQVGVPILEALGRKTTVLPGLLTKFLVYSLRTVPRWGKVKIMEKVMGGMTEHQRKKL
ncbi:SDR family NAD(P)-dependent oxidoreductase [Belliella kenyensis]|uniref:SDR family NAD(P)-dependent oxidoreductase n=1 Tax=Belliella kenyensis TaxID=1472724 RepID=A0ABV8EJ87_9BACT|nr:SDR family NAD(P)-dependent oxidoreductase [Belliella kenyensis]MCH7403339.1 SDR family NAD(P)-dependent oxidoreductase [Belliella kenyensis]MDN3602980.1 SDR family NAD(P)-dependent oxidoreductase [Belliella kenyensis]